ncbi:permease [Polymorphospora sp. NPDC050346]|uniref:permease n=1 Tax=Polymorphospora sp. NPDC050346 TaxID=3155780 RepID=UPI00340CFF0F
MPAEARPQGGAVEDVVEVVRLTLVYLVQLAPWFALAIFISAMVDLLYLDIIARRTFRRRGWVGVVLAAAIGAFSPFCSLTVIPLIRKLLAGGIPLSAVMAFWVASPAMDPEIFAMTAAQIGMPLATARLVGAVILSVGAGFVVLLMERRGMFKNVLRRGYEKQERLEVPQCGQDQPRTEEPALVGAGGGTAQATAACSQTAAQGSGGSAGVDDGEDDDRPWWPAAKASVRTRRNWQISFRNMGRDTLTLGKWLVLACVAEALIIMYVPGDLITTLLGKDPLVAIPLAAAISVPLYLNGVGAIPIIDGLLAKGMAPGAVVTFLLGGAVTTVPAMVAVRSVVTNRVFLTYLGISVFGSIIIGFGAQLVL